MAFMRHEAFSKKVQPDTQKPAVVIWSRHTIPALKSDWNGVNSPFNMRRTDI